MNAAWELDFTEAEPLDPRLAEEITGEGLDAFTGLYRSLLPFAAEHRENGEVRPTASQRCGSWAFCPVFLKICKACQGGPKRFLPYVPECFRGKLKFKKKKGPKFKNRRLQFNVI